jgi:hypothetical protein
MGGSLAPVRVAGFRWNGWQPSAVYAVGITSAHLGYTRLLRETVLASEIESIKEQKAELERTSAAVIELQKRGMKIYNNAIVLPDNYTEMLGETENGGPALFTD